MNLTLTDKFKLLTKGDISFVKKNYLQPTTVGSNNFQIIARQKQGHPCSHLNSLIIQTLQNQSPIKCEVKWYRVNKQCEQPVAEGEIYDFGVDDIGWILKAHTFHPKLGEAHTYLGPIIIDTSIRSILDSNILRGACKYQFTLKRSLVYNEEGQKVSEANSLNMLLGISLTRFIQITTSSRALDLKCNLDYSLNNPQIILEGEKQFSLKFMGESLLEFMHGIQPQRYQSVGAIEILLDSVSHVQRDSFILSLRLFSGRQQVEKSLTADAIDRFIQEQRNLFSEAIDINNLKLPGDLLLVISQQGVLIDKLMTKNGELEQQIIKAQYKRFINIYSQQVKQFEAEMKETIESYQQILANNSTLQLMRSGQNSSPGLNTITKEKMKILKDQIETLQKDQETRPFVFQNETKTQLIAKINELEEKLSKARRLNELLNEELKFGENPADEVLFLQAQIEQLRHENDLVHTYHKQLMDKEQEIYQLKNIHTSARFGNDAQLQQENDELRRENEQLKNQLLQRDYSTINQDSEQLQEMVNALERKNQSLLKEIDLLIKSPNQIKIIQQTAAQNQLDKTIKDLQNQIHELQEQNLKLKSENLSMSKNERLLSQPDQLYSIQTPVETVRSPIKRQRSTSSHNPIFEKKLPPPVPQKQSKSIFPPRRHNNSNSGSFVQTPKNDSSFDQQLVMAQYEQLIRGSQHSNL